MLVAILIVRMPRVINYFELYLLIKYENELVAGTYGLNRGGLTEAGEKCTKRNFKICNLEKYFWKNEIIMT